MQSGELLLSEFLKFLADCCTIHVAYYPDVGQLIPAYPGWLALQKHLPLVNKLLARKSAAAEPVHAGVRNSLALLTALVIPATSDRLVAMPEWARLLLACGADVHARRANGSTPLQNWLSRSDLDSAGGVILLLQAGADFDASHPQGQTALYRLCNNARLQLMRELTAAGWLEMADLNLPGVGGETPIACLQRKLAAASSDGALAEMCELLSVLKKLWTNRVRPSILAQLGVHEQLIPELAELIASYIDGGKDAAADNSESAAAAAASS